ncbi:PHO85 cyclin-5 [Cystobasidiomycetes sp. EMM_F5]
MEPPRVQDPFAPLSFDAMAADEADGAGLPPSMRPWNPEPPPQLQRGRSQSVLLPSIRHGRGLDRSASRSPERARSSYPAPTSRNAPGHPRTSAPTSEADKAKLVEGLVYAAVTAIQVLWTSEQDQQNHHIKLYQFVKELLRRSRSTCSTLQVALYYIHRSRDAIRERVRLVNEAKAEVQRMQRSSQAHQSWDPTGLLPSPSYERYNIADLMSPTSRAALLAREQDPMGRGREMFLSALVCASKFLQDRTYSNQAWSKISSLPVQVINANEKAFLEVMDYNLFVNSEVFRSCQYLLSPDAWTSADSLLDEGTRRLSELAERKGTKRGPEFPERTDRKQPPRPPTDSMSRPHLKLSIPRDGVLRAHSDYLPPPDLHDMLKYPSPRSKVPYPLTPTDTPRISPESPEEYTRTPPPSLHASFPLVGRSNTDTRLALRNTDKLQPPLGFNAPGRLPIPRLSSRLTRSSAPAAGPSNAMDLDDADDIKVSQIRQPRPRIPLRNTTSLVPYTSMEQLPRPMLTSNRFASASMMDASRFATHSSNSSSSGSCASLARLLNGTNVDDWQNGDQMVL